MHTVLKTQSNSHSNYWLKFCRNLKSVVWRAKSIRLFADAYYTFACSHFVCHIFNQKFKESLLFSCWFNGNIIYCLFFSWLVQWWWCYCYVQHTIHHILHMSSHTKTHTHTQMNNHQQQPICALTRQMFNFNHFCTLKLRASEMKQ